MNNFDFDTMSWAAVVAILVICFSVVGIKGCDLCMADNATLAREKRLTEEGAQRLSRAAAEIAAETERTRLRVIETCIRTTGKIVECTATVK